MESLQDIAGRVVYELRENGSARCVIPVAAIEQATQLIRASAEGVLRGVYAITLEPSVMYSNQRILTLRTTEFPAPNDEGIIFVKDGHANALRELRDNGGVNLFYFDLKSGLELRDRIRELCDEAWNILGARLSIVSKALPEPAPNNLFIITEARCY